MHLRMSDPIRAREFSWILHPIPLPSDKNSTMVVALMTASMMMVSNEVALSEMESTERLPTTLTSEQSWRLPLAPDGNGILLIQPVGTERFDCSQNGKQRSITELHGKIIYDGVRG
jgi:hypothetical protein